MRFKDFAAAEGGTRTDQMSLPPWKIQVQPGFNPRDPESSEVQDYIRGWADIVLSGGWNPAYAFLIRWDGKTAWMREGHCRQAGIALAATEEYRFEWMTRTGLEPALPVEMVKCDLTPPLTNEVDDLFIPLSSQAKLALTPEGWIEQIKKIAATGLDKKAIIRRLGQLGQKADFVRRMFDLAEAPAELRGAVASGKVALTEAVNAIREHKEDAPRVTRAAVEHAAARGKTRATGRDFRAVAPKARTEGVSGRTLSIAVAQAWHRWDRRGLASEELARAMYLMIEQIGPDAQPLAEAAE